LEKINLSGRQLQSMISAALGRSGEELAPIEYGDWSSAFSFSLDRREYVLRVSRIDEDFLRDAYAQRFNSPRLPVPKMIHFGRQCENWFAISEKAPGVLLDLLSPSQMQNTIPAIIDLLDALRIADVSGSHGFGGWDVEGNGGAESWRGSLLSINRDDPEDRIGGWRAKLEASQIDAGRFDRLFLRFASMVETCPEIRHLIHADLLHFNVLIDRGRISAVLDWGCARYGDFLYELAWFTFWGDWVKPMRGIDWRSIARGYYPERGVEIPDYDRRLDAYELHIGLDSVVYCAFTENWQMAEQVLRQMEGKL
jgi:hygromycin-B 4-O-kinase